MTAPRWTVRLRLTLWNVAVLAVTLAVLGVSLRYALGRSLLAAIDRQLEDRAQPPPQFGPDGGPPHRYDHPPPHVIDPDGRDPRTGEPMPILDPAGFQAALQGQTTYAVIEQDGVRFRVRSAPFVAPDGQFRGVTQDGQPMTPMEEELARLTRTLLTLLPLALILAASGALLLTDRALRPVRDIQEAAARMGAQDLSRRLPASGDDEFGDLARTINALLSRLETAFERQRRFTADASHELRTPLTVIKAHTSLALGDPNLPEASRKTMAAVDAAADRTIRLVMDLLLLARGDAGEARPAQTPLALADLLDRAAEGVRRPGIAPISVTVPASLPPVPGDADALLRVFENLLSNAVRHTPPDGRITITARPEGGTVIVTVADTGEGIPSEHLPRLGERFYRVDAARSRRQGGSGLGLAICRSLLESHGGTLRLSSVVGQGTTAEVRLPVG